MAKYTFKTTVTKHAECMERLASKCRWEKRSRLFVLAEWPDIVCQNCRKEMDIREVKGAAGRAVPMKGECYEN